MKKFLARKKNISGNAELSEVERDEGDEISTQPPASAYVLKLSTILSISLIAILLSGIVEALRVEDTFTLGHLFSWKLASHVLLELGIAGLIAGAVIYTVESKSRDEHKAEVKALIDETNQNLFNAVYKRYIPESILAEFETCVFMAPIVRQKYKVRYSFVDSETSGYKKVLLKNTYDIKNITNGNADTSISMFLEKPLAAALGDQTEITSLAIDGEIIDKKDYEKFIDKTVSTAVKLDYPLTMKKGNISKVELEGVLFKQDTDNEFWSFSEPTDGAEITVTSRDTNLSLSATANHSGDLEIEGPDVNGYYVLRLDKGLIPHQSIVFWWTHDSPRQENVS